MKRIICFIGYPGAGKSTLAGKLSHKLGIPLLHAKKTAGHLVPAYVSYTARLFGRLIPGIDRPFLEMVRQNEADTVFIDGFPRDLECVDLLAQFSRNFNWHTTVVYIRFPRWSGIASAQRQLARELRKGLRPDRFFRIPFKIARDACNLNSILQSVADNGINLITLNALESPEVLEGQMSDILNADLQHLPWDTKTLQRLEEVAPDAWITGGGHIYKPFFNGRFGPFSQSWDADIRVWGEERARELQLVLDQRWPDTRWHVKDACTWAKKETNQDIRCVEDAFGLMALFCVCAGIRWRNGKVQIQWGHPEAERDLRLGILRPNEGGQIAYAPAKADKIAEYYPGVQADFIGHSRRSIISTFDNADQEIKRQERGGRRLVSRLTATEKELAAGLTAYRFRLASIPEPVPLPAPHNFPDNDPWEASDSAFRIWIANQTRSRNPVGGHDQYLHHALRMQANIEQKPSHQGWSLRLHTIHVLFSLSTEDYPQYRRAMRIAALWHDIGKVDNVLTPGAHALIGAKKWLQLQHPSTPQLRKDEEALICHLIRNHDLYGRVERGLWDESYQGGLDPSAARAQLTNEIVPVRVMIGLAKEMWKADVGAISLYRWMIPLGDLIEDLLASGC